jgi:two-component sensor histidine kinase
MLAYLFLFLFQISTQNFSDIKHINHIERDQNGFVWFSSINTIYRTDGYHIYHIRHEGDFDRIQTVEHVGHKLFYGTNSGLLQVNTDELSTKIINFNRYRSAFSNPNNIVDILKIDSARIAIGALIGGVLIYNIEKDSVERHYQFGRSGQEDLISNQAISLDLDRFGRIWVATRNRSFEIIDILEQKVYHQDNSDFIKSLENVSRIKFIDDETCFIAGPGNSLHLIKIDDRFDFTYQRVTNTSNLDYIVNDFIEIDDQHIFLSDNHQFILDIENRSISQTTLFNDLELDHIKDIYIKPNEYILVGTENEGLKRYPSQRLSIDNLHFDATILDTYETTSEMMMVSTTAIYVLDKEFNLKKKLPYNPRNSLVVDNFFHQKNELLTIVTNENVYYYRGGNSVSELNLDDRQRIFSSTYNGKYLGLNTSSGIELFDLNHRHGLKKIKTLNTSSISDFVSSINLLYQDVMSVITHNNNLFYYDLNTNEITNANEYDNFNFTKFKRTKDQIIANDLQRGISAIMDYGADAYLEVDTLETYLSSKHKDVLFFENEKYLYIDENGFIYSHNHGENIQINESYGFNHFPYQRFTSADDQIYISGNRGITIAPQDFFSFEDNPSELKISNFSFYNDSVLSMQEIAKDEISISYQLNTFRIDLSDVNFLYLVPMQYRVTEFGEAWLRVEGSSVNFNYLEPGTYSFESRIDGSDQIIRKTIIIEPPWWQSWWFQLFVISIITVIVIYILNEKKREDAVLEANKQKISKDIHDEIGNKLIKLHYLNDDIISDENTDEKVKTRLSDISSIIHSLTRILDDIVWNLNTKNNTFIELINRIEYLLDFSFQNTNFSVKFDKLFKFEDFELKQNVRENLFYIIKESITNTLKHREEGQIKMMFSLDKNKFVYIIQNPMKENTTQSKRKSYGLQNMELRANDMNAMLSIRKNSGTFSLRLKGKL